MTKHIHPCGFCSVIECDGDCPEAEKDAAMTDPRMTPTNDAPVTVEQCDREAAASCVVPRKVKAAILAGERDESSTVQAFARRRLAALASAPAGDGVDMAKYADMTIDEKANAMADDCVGDGWELVGYFREKARQAQANADSTRDAVTRLVLARPRAAVGSVKVERVETVPLLHPFDDSETPPIWRIVIDGYCADFEVEQAARNFAAAIERMNGPRAAVGEREDEVGLVEAARDLLDAQKRLGPAVAFRLDLWACLEANLEGMS